MNAAEALRLARENGIRIAVSGADLMLDAAREPAPAVLEALRHHKAEIISLLSPGHGAWTAEAWRAFFSARVHIAEVESGQTLEQATATAFECCVVEWLNRHPCVTRPDRCAACGQPDREGHAVVPFGAGHHDYTWLHPECWEGWHMERRREARKALSAMGIQVPLDQTEGFGHVA